DIDDSESLLFRDNDYRSQECAPIGLRKKSSLKAGPMHKSPYIDVSTVGRGRGRGGRNNNKRGRGGRNSKAITRDEEVKCTCLHQFHVFFTLCINNEELLCFFCL
ncbi:hypothetical protein LINPERPRIM_LOCUS24849, partial [Linum perenne]